MNPLSVLLIMLLPVLFFVVTALMLATLQKWLAAPKFTQVAATTRAVKLPALVSAVSK